MAQTTISLRIDDKLKQSFDLLCDEFGFSNSAAITMFIKTVVREQKIPFEIKAKSEDLIRAKAIKSFSNIQSDIAASKFEDMTIDQINNFINSVRYGER